MGCADCVQGAELYQEYDFERSKLSVSDKFRMLDEREFAANLGRYEVRLSCQNLKRCFYQCSQAASRTAAGIIHTMKGNMFLYVISEFIDHGDLQGSSS